MKTLFIDTHLNDLKIHLYDNDVLSKKEEILGIAHNSTFLMPSVQKVLDNEVYDQIIVVNGPGSFTGVRLGVTIAKTLAYTMQKDIYPLSYFDLMNLSSDNDRHMFAISDGNGYFIGEYNNHKKEKEFYYLNNADYRVFAEDQMIETDVFIDMKKVIDYVKTLEPTNAHAVNPIYIKLIGVEYDKKNN